MQNEGNYPKSINQLTTSSNVLLSETSNCSVSEGLILSVYPPTLVLEAPEICETPNSRSSFLIFSDSLVEIIIPVYGTEILIRAVIFLNISSSMPLSNAEGSISSAFLILGTEIV